MVVLVGIIGSLTSNPIDVIKIRMMVDTKQYPSIFLSAYRILSKEGIFGFYKGVAPSTLRGKPSLCLISLDRSLFQLEL